MTTFKALLFRFLKRINALPEHIIDARSLDDGRGLEKQLDEYRELLEAIEKETGFFSSELGVFSINHAEGLDDYLSYLYELRFGKNPTPETAINYLRHKPSFK
ncbi:hypothetical protein VII00023_20592 [Vibrio ichthyoenteri ATCC 700023]|uniref:Uncharacterized protein n=1 Tax=Vibrio ichthyoenteri ATCC 700023 TaxID=870968 RepID=F9S7T1_9VIBR|nr:hypothetical protein [Vibrio ichthyoenteri]EGU30981.1 hypothetical protein VII00023_20592 [Vibrio ichthyoenteri ATCC 700023]